MITLPPGGVFAGTFFGPEHDVFNWWVTMRMTFLTKQECLDLFKNFTIHYFDEYREKDDEDALNHIFTIIAYKN